MKCWFQKNQYRYYISFSLFKYIQDIYQNKNKSINIIMIHIINLNFIINKINQNISIYQSILSI